MMQAGPRSRESSGGGAIQIGPVVSTESAYDDMEEKYHG
jgi:hypothetical protein